MKGRPDQGTVHRRSAIRFLCVGILCIGFLAACPVSLSASERGGDLGADRWFMVISDVHVSNDSAKLVKLSELVTRINSGEYNRIEFLVISGDCVSSFLESREDELTDPGNNRVIKLMNVLDDLEKPFYLVMGNHEYKFDRQKDSDAPFSQSEIDTIDTLWKRFTSFDPYYAFQNGGMKFLVLNSMRGRPEGSHFDDDQVAWVRDELSGGDPVILFFHHPVRTDHFRIWAKKKDMISVEKEPEFMDEIRRHSGQIRGIFVGHGHLWVSDLLYGTIPVYETRSFGDDPRVIGYMVGLDTSEKRIAEIRKEFL